MQLFARIIQYDQGNSLKKPVPRLPYHTLTLTNTMTESNSSIEATDSHLGRNLSVEPTSPINSNSSSVDTLKFPDQCHLTFHSCLEPTSNPPITLPPTPCIASAPTHPMPTTGFAVPLAEYALRTGISSIGMTTCVTSSCQLSASPSQVCKTCVGYKKIRLQTTSDILLSPINYDHTMFLQEQRRDRKSVV